MFRFSEKAAKIWQNLPLILMLLSKHQHKFFKFCGLLIKWFLNYKNMALHIFKFFNIIKCFYLSSQQTQFVVSNFSAIVFLARFYQKVEWSALKGYFDNTGQWYLLYMTRRVLHTICEDLWPHCLNLDKCNVLTRALFLCYLHRK